MCLDTNKHDSTGIIKDEDDNVNDDGVLPLSFKEDNASNGNESHEAGFTNDQTTFDLDADFKDELRRCMPHYSSTPPTHYLHRNQLAPHQHRQRTMTLCSMKQIDRAVSLPAGKPEHSFACEAVP